jgi:parallel beta-helix repeat protein
MKKGVLFAVVLLSISILASSVLGVTFYSSKTLSTDLNEGVELAGNSIYLDCAGHKIAGAGSGNGIYIHGQSGITIKNCDITGFVIGIQVVWGDNITISSNTVRNSSYGIVLDSTDNSLISSNTINNNEHWGIELKSGTDNLRYNVFDLNIIKNNKGAGIYFGDAPGKTSNNITRNTIVNNSEGIYFETGSNNNLIKENKITKNTRGIKMEGAVGQNDISSNIIKYNTYGLDMLQEVGMYISWPTNNLFYNNLFNNPRNVYHDESSGTKWNLASVDCSRGANIMGGRCLGGNFWNDYTGIEVGTENYGIGDTQTPYHGDYFPLVGIDCGSNIIKSTTLNRDLDDCSNGLNIAANNVVLDCAGHNITGNGLSIGINITNRKNVTIKNCDISGFVFGVWMANLNSSIIISNSIANNSYNGIVLKNGFNNTIQQNVINDNGLEGIFMGDGAKYNLVYDNTVNYNNKGIYFYWSGNNIIDKNNIKNNRGDGIWLSYSNSNIIKRNVVENNSGRGINIGSGSNSLIFNNFLNNSKNAYDDLIAGGNIWNTTRTCNGVTNIVNGNCIGGNFWSNYTGVDNGNGGRVAGDKIGDTNLPQMPGIPAGIKISEPYGDWLPLVFVSGGITCATIADCSILSHDNCLSPCCIFNVSATPQCRKNCSSVNCGGFIDSNACENSGSGSCCRWDDVTLDCKPIPGSGAKFCNYNGIVDTSKGEECDPGCNPSIQPCPNGAKVQNLSGQTCESKGHEPGTLSCTQECMFNYGLCGGKCEQTQTTSSWTDTGESSKDNCLRTFNGVDKTCCPNDQTCFNVLDTSTNHNINTCVKSGIVRCGGLNGYENEEDCNNFNSAIAEASIKEIPAAAGIICGTTCTGADCIFTRCLCVWNSTYNECQAGAEEIEIVNGVTTTIGTCSYSITEGTCNRGIKTITYTAIGSMQGCVGGPGPAEVSCFAATEIPFFNFWSLMVTIAGLVVFYAMRR